MSKSGEGGRSRSSASASEGEKGSGEGRGPTLERQAQPPKSERRRWLQLRRAALACAVVGVGSLVATILYQASRGELMGRPPLVLSAPPLIASAALAIASLARREPGLRLVAAGIAGALTATVLGYALVGLAVLLLAYVALEFLVG